MDSSSSAVLLVCADLLEESSEMDLLCSSSASCASFMLKYLWRMYWLPSLRPFVSWNSFFYNCRYESCTSSFSYSGLSPFWLWGCSLSLALSFSLSFCISALELCSLTSRPLKYSNQPKSWRCSSKKRR